MSNININQGNNTSNDTNNAYAPPPSESQAASTPPTLTTSPRPINITLSGRANPHSVSSGSIFTPPNPDLLTPRSFLGQPMTVEPQEINTTRNNNQDQDDEDDDDDDTDSSSSTSSDEDHVQEEQEHEQAGTTTNTTPRKTYGYSTFLSNQKLQQQRKLILPSLPSKRTQSTKPQKLSSSSRSSLANNINSSSASTTTTTPNKNTQNDNDYIGNLVSDIPSTSTKDSTPVSTPTSSSITPLLQQQQQQQRRRQSSSQNVITHKSKSFKQRVSDTAKYYLNPSPLWKNVIKCSVAYFIASLFTFFPPFSEFLGAPLDVQGPVPNGHFMATIIVYYNPAKDIGAMVEADLFMVWAALFAAIVCLGSMSTTWIFIQANLYLLAHLIVLCFWLSASMGLIAFMKTHVTNPTLTSACSMATLINAVILCKEGAIQLGKFEFEAIAQMFIIVIIGTLVSNLVCFILWPSSATTRLQTDMNRSLDSFATLVDLLTRTVLPHGNIAYTDARVRRAVEAHHTSFTSLQADLDSAKLELLDSRIQRQLQPYEDAVASMKRLAQHLTGLRSGCSLQHSYLKSHAQSQYQNQNQNDHNETSTNNKHRDQNPVSSSSASMETEPETGTDSDANIDINQENDPVLQSFENKVGPSLKYLTSKCRQVLRTCQRSFIQSKAGLRTRSTILAQAQAQATYKQQDNTHNNNNPTNRTPLLSKNRSVSSSSVSGSTSQQQQTQAQVVPDRLNAITNDLQEASLTFFSDLTTDFKKLYNQQPTLDSINSSSSPDISNPNEQILILYFFLFNLQKFVEEVCILANAFVHIRAEEERIEKEKIAAWQYFGLAPFDKSFSIFRRLYRSLISPLVRFTVLIGCFKQADDKDDKAKSRKKFSRFKSIMKRFVILIWFSSHKPSSFPPIGDNAFTSHAVDTSKLSFWMTCKRKIWLFSRFLRRQDLRYAIKTGVGAGILSSPAFFPLTRPYWLDFRMEWAVISYMVVVAVTLGQTNVNSVFRIAGTLFGACVAMLVYETLNHHPILLSIFGFLFSLPCFYIVLTRPMFASSARFILLTYNLVCLYSYNKRDENLKVWDIAYKRFAAVSIGVIWGWLITHFWWPNEARSALRKGLSDFFIHCAFFYEKIVISQTLTAEYSSYSSVTGNRSISNQESQPVYNNNNGYDDDTADTTPLLKKDHQNMQDQEEARIINFKNSLTEMELELRVSLINLGKLLEPTKTEPRLKGPFPVESYRTVLQKCQTLLDQLHAMRIIADDQSWTKTVQKKFVGPANKERKEMVGSILLYFSILASTVALKSPMPAFLPTADEAHERFLTRSRQLVVKERKRAHLRASVYLLYFAYALALKDLIRNTEAISNIFQELFGVLGGYGNKSDFENLFKPRPIIKNVNNNNNSNVTLSSAPSSSSESVQ